jgi:hypothetical protein
LNDSLGGAMYILLLLLAAFFLISILGTNWPVKFYHHFLLKQLAEILEAVPERNGLLFSNVYSQINTIYQGKELKIRYIEGSIDSLKAHSGLELRMHLDSQAVMEFYPFKRNKHEWGDFIRFLTGDPQFDSQWFILTNNPTTAGTFWNSSDLKGLLLTPGLEQVLLNQHELIVQLKNYRSAEKVKQFIDRLVRVRSIN